jgi:type II secretory pathway pseudopilin PulG
VSVEIDRDAAHDAAQNELSKPIYPKGSLTDRLEDWLSQLVYKLIVEASSVPGGWFTLTVVLLLVAVAAVVAVRIAMRTIRTNRGRDSALFGANELTSAEHRATSEQLAAQGNWSAAIRHRLRAVARHLEETGVLNPVPGRTATELARDAGAATPGLTDELRRAAETFNDVTYGERPGTESGYRLIADLDDHLRFSTPAAADAAAASGSSDAWADVR